MRAELRVQIDLSRRQAVEGELLGVAVHRLNTGKAMIAQPGTHRPTTTRQFQRAWIRLRLMLRHQLKVCFMQPGRAAHQ